MSQYRVTYELLSEARTETSNGSGSTFTQNLTTVVSANGPNQAREMVEAMNGGWSYCRAQGAVEIG